MPEMARLSYRILIPRAAPLIGSIAQKSGLDTPRYAPLALSDLSKNLRALQAAGAAYLFIDTAPSIGSVNAELFAVADMILIPLNPTPADLHRPGQGTARYQAVRQAV